MKSVTYPRRSVIPYSASKEEGYSPFHPDNFAPLFDPAYMLGGQSYDDTCQYPFFHAQHPEEVAAREEEIKADNKANYRAYLAARGMEEPEPEKKEEEKERYSSRQCLYDMFDLKGYSQKEKTSITINFHSDLQTAFQVMYRDLTNSHPYGDKCTLNILYRYALWYGLAELKTGSEFITFVELHDEFLDRSITRDIHVFETQFYRNILLAAKPEIEKVRDGKKHNIAFRLEHEESTFSLLHVYTRKLLVNLTSLCHICMWQALAHGNGPSKNIGQAKVDTFLREMRCRAKILYGAIHG